VQYKLQRRFTKRIPGLSSYSYEARLALLKLESLETRSIIADSVYVYKIVFNIVDTDPDNFFSVTGNNSTTRGHACKLIQTTVVLIQESISFATVYSQCMECTGNQSR